MGSENFNSSFLQYKAISAAPKSIPFHVLSDPQLTQDWIEKERENQYRAEDSRGNIFLIKNPLTWEERDGWKIRPTPVRLTGSTLHKPKFKPKREEGSGKAVQIGIDEVLI